MQTDTLIRLKAEAYDTLAQIEAYQRKLVEINQKITQEAQKLAQPTLPDKA